MKQKWRPEKRVGKWYGVAANDNESMRDDDCQWKLALSKIVSLSMEFSSLIAFNVNNNNFCTHNNERKVFCFLHSYDFELVNGRRRRKNGDIQNGPTIAIKRKLFIRVHVYEWHNENWIWMTFDVSHHGYSMPFLAWWAIDKKISKISFFPKFLRACMCACDLLFSSS